MVVKKETEEVKEEISVPVEKDAVITQGEDERPEVKIDLTGEGFKTEGRSFDRVKIAEDSYKATVSDVVFMDVQKWEAKPGVKEKKFIFSYLIELPNVDPVVITSFVNPSITKSNNVKYSNSKLFELISVAGLLEEVNKLSDELSSFEGLSKWVPQMFIGRDCRVSVEDNKAKTCSNIRKVLSFEPLEVK